MTYKEEYLKNGVAKIPSVFSKSEMDQFRNLALLSYRKSKDSEIQFRNGFPALLFNPKGVDEYRFRLKPIVKEILGDNVLQLNNQYYFRMPGDGDQFTWHQDISFRTPADKFNQIETGYLQTAIIVDPMDEGNGGIEFILGSHLGPDLNLIPRDNSEKGLREYNHLFTGTVIPCQPGDVLIWSVMIIHGSKPNQSNRWRSYYMNGFAKDECVDPVLGFPWFLR